MNRRWRSIGKRSWECGNRRIAWLWTRTHGAELRYSDGARTVEFYVEKGDEATLIWPERLVDWHWPDRSTEPMTESERATIQKDVTQCLFENGLKIGFERSIA